MQRRDFVYSLVDSLSRPGQAVAYPDHPLLLRGPDVLASVEGTLVAYFVHAGGGPRPDSATEQSRYLLARLALPREAQLVLAIPNHVEPGLAEVALVDWLQTGPPTSGHVRSSWQPADDQAANLVDRLRRFHDRRFADAWTASSRPTNQEQGPSQQRAPTSARGGHPAALDREWLSVDNGVIYAQLAHARTRATLVRRLQALIAAAVELDYGLRWGRAGLADTLGMLTSGDRYLALHHAYVADGGHRSRAFDALKPYRAAAFAGVWAGGIS